MSIFERLTKFVEKTFKTTVEIFLEALKLSPNAQGYVSGSITELLLKKKLEELGFEVKRIREKWEGRKHPNHHGDFYFRKPENPWFVLESKGVKSNSEKWHKLYNYGNLKKFLINHADKIYWIDKESPIENQNEYASNLYDFKEIQKYPVNPKRETPKSKAIATLRNFSREEISRMINAHLNYAMAQVKVLETHFVSGVSGASERTQATPRKDEFNLISIDICLRYPEHKFLFANPKQLESSGDDANHLQQNYVVGFVFIAENGENILSLTEDWFENLDEIYETLSPEDVVNEKDMQIDSRNLLIKD